MTINENYFLKLYLKYKKELEEITPLIRKKFLKISQQGFRATFSDFEGEVLYVLIRERKPEIIYEISPDCGYSTIYMVEAINRNNLSKKKSKLYSFEIEKYKNSEPLLRVINNTLINQSPHHKIIIGDAMNTTKNYPNPDLCLIDSNHEAFFGQWYIKHIFPRINDIALIQDITFYDRREYSGEAEVLLNFLKNRNYMSLGVVERKDSFYMKRESFPNRRFYETNSILVSFKEKIQNIKPTFKDLTNDNDFSKRLTHEEIYKIEKKLEFFPRRQNLWRTYFLLAKNSECKIDKKVFLNMAIGHAISESNFNLKSLKHLSFLSLKSGYLKTFIKLLIIKPRIIFGVIELIWLTILSSKFFSKISN